MLAISLNTFIRLPEKQKTYVRRRVVCVTPNVAAFSVKNTRRIRKLGAR